MSLNQVGVSKAQAVDLSSLFYIGPSPIPSFGTASEIMLPWNGELA
jgi:hypothetical protein